MRAMEREGLKLDYFDVIKTQIMQTMWGKN